MKRMIGFFITLLFLSSCTENQEKKSSITDLLEDQHQEIKEEEDINNLKRYAVALYETGLYSTSSKSGESKNLKTVKFGETVEVLADTTTNKAERAFYLKLKLENIEGWDKEKLYALDGKLGVTTKNIRIYSQPDILSKADKRIYGKELVVVQENKQNGWLHIFTKNKAIEGWVKKGKSVSTESIDIEVAHIMRQIKNSALEEEKTMLISDLIDNSRYGSSVFHQEILQKYEAHDLQWDLDTSFIDSLNYED